MGLFDDLMAAVNDVKAIGTEFTEDILGLKDEIAQPIADVKEHATDAYQSISETVAQTKDTAGTISKKVNKLIQ